MARMLALLVLVAAVAPFHDARAHSDSRPSVGHWVCNAYGYGGARNAWRTVTGGRSPDLLSAVESAMDECRKKLNGCQRSGCWPS
jgi:hypothetical protein